jgi:Protein of unknown function (DUF2844)
MRLVKIVLTLAMVLPAASYASLGAAPSGGSSGVKSLLANQPGAASYSVHESVTSDGVTVREYTLPNNVVFAVTWQGPIRPDMSALLGSYFPNAVATGESHPHGTGPMTERNGDLVIQSVGHPGRFFGKAYLPRLVPASVSADELQ